MSKRLSLAVALVVVLAQSPGRTASPPQAGPGQLPPLLLGTAWYPEQWPEARWEADWP